MSTFATVFLLGWIFMCLTPITPSLVRSYESVRDINLILSSIATGLFLASLIIHLKQ